MKGLLVRLLLLAMVMVPHVAWAGFGTSPTLTVSPGLHGGVAVSPGLMFNP